MKILKHAFYNVHGWKKSALIYYSFPFLQTSESEVLHSTNLLSLFPKIISDMKNHNFYRFSRFRILTYFQNDLMETFTKHAIHNAMLKKTSTLICYFFFFLQTSESAVPHSTSRHSNVSSVADVTESWEFRSALEAPIAKLESLDEIDRQVPKFQFD